MKTQTTIRMPRRWASLATFTTCLLSAAPTVFGFFGGDGSAGAPYQVATAADLDGSDRLGKGMTLLEEFLADTDPNDPLSRFVTDNPLRAGTTVEIHIQPSSPDRRYTLWRSTNLADWSPVTGQINVPGGNGPLVDVAPPTDNAFYRVAAGLP